MPGLLHCFSLVTTAHVTIFGMHSGPLRSGALLNNRLLRSLASFCRGIAVPAGLEPWAGHSVGIEQAATLPASWYTSPSALHLEKQHVFHNTWQAGVMELLNSMPAYLALAVGFTAAMAAMAEMVCAVEELQQPGDFLCGSLADVRYLLVRGQDGQLRAFHNVCRHHAAAVAQGAGNQLLFQCPYHNWTYDDKGRLVKATRLKGIQHFKASQYGLHPIAVQAWGHFVFLHLNGGRPAPAQQIVRAATTGRQNSIQHAASPPSVEAWLGAGSDRLLELGMCDRQLVHLTRREYTINCNWKVFCDNFLDGGYHVPYAHKDLAGGLDMSSYTNELHQVLSIQHCGVKEKGNVHYADMPADNSSSNSSSSSRENQQSPNTSSSADRDASSTSIGSNESHAAAQLDRLASGRDAAYAFVFPNLMINRYGPWMDTNVVLPLSGDSADRCRVIFEYWLDCNALHQAALSTHIHLQQPTAVQRSADSTSSSTSGDAVLAAARQSQFVQESLASSHKVQEEDIALCEAVQTGLKEPSYGVGRYAPGPEAPMYHFHTLYYQTMLDALFAQQL